MTADDDTRPDPDALLARLQADERRRRATLKVFFGAAPGVGKTFAMLETARRLKADGLDVVIGVIETHGRAETRALVDGLEILPRRKIDHRGVILEELDLEAALARKPDVILVDELAHTNAPGSRHVKRWQDVMELLEAGIDVHTTLNVQHIESLGDVVQQITDVKIRETIPDAVLERADEIELIDLAPEELLDRLAEGKVYMGDAAGRAAQHFFQRGNLLALRELALRRTAERVDVEVQAYRRERGIVAPWQAAERILVCVGASPSSERLIRAGKRTAERLGAEWAVVAVEIIGAAPLGDKDRDRLETHLRLAEALGATVARLRGARVVDALLDYAREHNVTRIIAGKPTHSRWRDRLRGSLLDELIRGSGGIDIHVIAPVERDGGASTPLRRKYAAAPAYAYVWAVAGVTAITILGLLTFEYVTLPDIAMSYLVAVMAASLTGRGPSLLAASLAVLSFDFFFVPPRFTFAVAEWSYLITFVVMFAAGSTISTLTVRLRRQEIEAIDRERRAGWLLTFTRDVAGADGIDEIAAVTVRHVEEMLGMAASLLVPELDAGLVSAAGLMPLAAQEVTVARWSYEHVQPAGYGTQTLPGAHIVAIPLISGDRALGVLVVQARKGARALDVEQRHLADTIARQAALAIGRAQLVGEARDATVRARTEELRSSLLSAVSHDLRTPLAAITAASTSLRDHPSMLSDAARAQLVSTIVEEAERLERVLTNLLGITRLEAGLEPSREWVPVEELVGGALTRVEDVLGDRAVKVDVPPDLLVSVDPILFEQVLINLFENGVRHGAPPFELSARHSGDEIEIVLRDHGPGVPAGNEADIFEKFFRATDNRVPGVGLGLAVCRGVVEAHGGTISASTASGGGAQFQIRLPAGTPPVVRSEEAP